MDPNRSQSENKEQQEDSAQPDPQAPEGQSSGPQNSAPIYDPSLTADERQMAMFCHFAAFFGLVFPFGSIIGPLVIWLMKKDESAYIDFHGREAVNFNITMGLMIIACALLIFVFIGILLLPALLFFWFVMIIIAGVKANDGLNYRYPFSFRLIS